MMKAKLRTLGFLIFTRGISWRLVIGGLMMCLLWSTRFEGAPSSQPSGVRSIPLTRTVRIRLTTADADPDASASGTLQASVGAPDELPEGPDAFDVLNDGGFLISDPLRRRLARFNSQGNFVAEWKVGFSSDDIVALAGGLVQVREASTGDSHVFDQDGHRLSDQIPVAALVVEARLNNQTSGTITRPDVRAGQNGSIKIELDKPGLTLLSIQGLMFEPGGAAYVALEATGGGEEVNVKKFVRKYSAEGRLLAETSELPLDYYVAPLEEIRVRNDVVYQLMTSRTEVDINIWDMH